MADAGFAAQDVGEFRRRDRGHGAEKGGVVRRSMVATERLAISSGLPNVRQDGAQALRRGPCPLPPRYSARGPSAPDCQRTSDRRGEGLTPCVSLVRELAGPRSAPPRHAAAGGAP